MKAPGSHPLDAMAPKHGPLDSVIALLRRAPRGPAVVGATPSTGAQPNTQEFDGG